MSSLKFAIFGTGFWSQFQLGAWTELDGVECVALYNRTKVDLSAGAFSMQGKSGQKMINVLVLILVPAIISGFLISTFGIVACFKIIGGLGLAGILLLPFTFNLILKGFANKKYIMGAAYRAPL